MTVINSVGNKVACYMCVCFLYECVHAFAVGFFKHSNVQYYIVIHCHPPLWVSMQQHDYA